MKLLFWTNMPNHYQRAFVKALSELCDLQVIYFEGVPPDRQALGWAAAPALMSNERICTSLDDALRLISDWKDRVHLVPNYGTAFQRSLARHLVRHSVSWVHWSESTSPGVRWWLRLPYKLWWARLVNNHALGSFSNGNRAERDFARMGIYRSRTAFLPYMSEPAMSAAPDLAVTEFTRGRKAFLFLGSLSRRKGIDLLLRAAARVLPDAPDWVVVLVGNEGLNGRYHRLAERLNLTGRVLFRGAVPPSELSGVISACRVLVLPSRYDGWGVAINEGLLGGLALLVSHMCGAGEHLVVPGRNGFRFEAGDERQLAEVMTLYTRNPGLAEEHGAASKSLVSLIDPKFNARVVLSTINCWRMAQLALSPVSGWKDRAAPGSEAGRFSKVSAANSAIPTAQSNAIVNGDR
jgi:glycosyltransferase involved in cell wall biosynthesis